MPREDERCDDLIIDEGQDFEQRWADNVPVWAQGLILGRTAAPPSGSDFLIEIPYQGQMS